MYSLLHSNHKTSLKFGILEKTLLKLTKKGKSRIQELNPIMELANHFTEAMQKLQSYDGESRCAIKVNLTIELSSSYQLES